MPFLPYCLKGSLFWPNLGLGPLASRFGRTLSSPVPCGGCGWVLLNDNFIFLWENTPLHWDARVVSIHMPFPPLPGDLHLGSQGRTGPHRNIDKQAPKEKSPLAGQAELTGDHHTQPWVMRFREKGGSQRSPCLVPSCFGRGSWSLEMLSDQTEAQEMGPAFCHPLLIQLRRCGPYWFVRPLPQLPYLQSAHNCFRLR